MIATSYLGHGAQGNVLLYDCGSDEVQVAIKTVEVGSDEEDVHGWTLLTEMRRRGLPSARMVIPTGMVRTAELVCFPMAPADCTLDVAVRLWGVCSVAAALCVTKALRILYKDGYVYCDIKPENVLVKQERGVSHVVFGDLGSLVRVRESGVSTYPPPEHPSGVGVPATERAAVWGVGVLLATLVWGHDPRLCYVTDAANFTPAEAEVHRRAVMATVASRIDGCGRSSPMGQALQYCLEDSTASLFGTQLMFDRVIKIIKLGGQAPQTPPAQPRSDRAGSPLEWEF